MIVRVRGIKKTTVRKGGKVYVYYRHRATGIRLKSAPGTAEFAAEVATLNARASRSTPLPGTLGGLIKLYKTEPAFTERAVRTRRDYEKVFDYLEPMFDMPLIEITSGTIYEIQDKAFKAKKRRFANYVIQVLSLVMAWGVKRQHMETNPAFRIEFIKRPRGAPKANRPWTKDECETVLEAAAPALRVMIALGMFTGLREGDALRLPWSAYDGSVIASKASKTGEPIWIPAHSRLRTILDGEKKKAVVIAVNSRGQPWTQNGFQSSFRKLLKRLEAKNKIGPGLTFHGLRHTVGTAIIDAGGDTRDVMAILGHASSQSAEHYSRYADRKRRASATVKRLERAGKGNKAIAGNGQTLDNHGKQG